MTKGIARRGRDPAWQAAPPRLRQSHVRDPFQFIEPERGFWRRLFSGSRGVIK